MSITTPIPWADSTCNGMIGCDGCELWTKNVRSCYAGRIVESRGRAGNLPFGWPSSFDTPRVLAQRIHEALTWSSLIGKKREGKPWLNDLPRHIFFCDMGDPFTVSLPADWLDEFIEPMERSPHVWIILTKNAGRMAAYFQRLGRVPDNFILGCSVTNSTTLRRAQLLTSLPESTCLMLNLEPLVAPVTLPDLVASRFKWLLAGGETGPYARPMYPGWSRYVRDFCYDAGLKFFFLKTGDWLPAPIEMDDQVWVGPHGEIDRRRGDVSELVEQGYVRMAQLQKSGGWVDDYNSPYYRLDGRTYREMPSLGIWTQKSFL